MERELIYEDNLQRRKRIWYTRRKKKIILPAMILDFIQTAPVASLIFLVTIISSIAAFTNPQMHRDWMLHPYSFVHRKRYQTLITSGLIHGDWGHLIFNMVTFFYFAFGLEEVMSSVAGGVGHLFFGLLYLMGMMLSDVSSIVKHRNDPSYYSLGASGAISAVLFSFILFEPAMKISMIFIPIPIPAPIFAVLYIIYSIWASRRNHDNINHEAHLWGALFGLILTMIFFPGIIPYFIDQVKQMI
jgi:membrane associated rhomboid family serine protease